MSDQKEHGEVLFGVSLDDLASAHAAERAGVPLDERLSEMGLDSAAFSRAEQAWSQRLSASLRDEPALFVAYDLSLARALARDAPKILPLEEDLGAWISFQGHFQRAADPAGMVKAAGLSLSEVARLNGAWAAKLAADPSLALQAASLRAETPSPIPTIRREQRRPTPAHGEATTRPAEHAVSPVLPAVPGNPSPAAEAGVALFPAPIRPAPPAHVPVATTPAMAAAQPPRWDAGNQEVDLSTLGLTAVPFQSRPDEGGHPASSHPTSPRAGMGTTGDVPADLLSRLARGPTPFAPTSSTPPLPDRGPGANPLRQEGEPGRAGEAPAAAPRAFSSMTTDVPADLLARIAKGPVPFEPRAKRE